MKKATITNDNFILHPWKVNQVVECKKVCCLILISKGTVISKVKVITMGVPLYYLFVLSKVYTGMLLFSSNNINESYK